MLIHKGTHAISIAVKILAFAAIVFSLIAQTPVQAAGLTRQQSGKHKSVVKKSHQRTVKLAKQKKNKVRRNKAAQQNGKARKTAARVDSSSLRLTEDIELGPSSPAVRQAPLARPVNKPHADETDTPLQIGRILYQRNGEIRQLEGQ